MLGLLAALPAEAACLPGAPQPGPLNFGGAPALLAVSGPGAAAAALAARRLLATGARRVLVFGICGGLSPLVRPGNLLLPDMLLPESGRPLPADGRMVEAIHGALAAAGLSALRGPLLTVAQPILDSRAKLAAFTTTRALGVDMESCGAVDALGVPWAVLRAVCDPADRSVPPQAAGMLDAGGNLRPLAAASALVRRPWLVADWWRLGQDYSAALRGLRRGLAALDGQGVQDVLTSA